MRKTPELKLTVNLRLMWMTAALLGQTGSVFILTNYEFHTARMPYDWFQPGRNGNPWWEAYWFLAPFLLQALCLACGRFLLMNSGMYRTAPDRSSRRYILWSGFALLCFALIINWYIVGLHAFWDPADATVDNFLLPLVNTALLLAVLCLARLPAMLRARRENGGGNVREIGRPKPHPCAPAAGPVLAVLVLALSFCLLGYGFRALSGGGFWLWDAFLPGDGRMFLPRATVLASQGAGMAAGWYLLSNSGWYRARTGRMLRVYIKWSALVLLCQTQAVFWYLCGMRKICRDITGLTVNLFYLPTLNSALLLALALLGTALLALAKALRRRGQHTSGE